jgi:predicted HAD superfamily Cof-like phosphohydrolase
MDCVISQSSQTTTKETQMTKELLSSTALSNLYTMGCTCTIDPKQNIPNTPYTIPPEETRLLRAKLILEEALETCEALGFRIQLRGDVIDDELTIRSVDLKYHAVLQPNMEEIIDGCCDLNYVSIGTLCACGVPDVPHQNHVDICNNAKFPKGEPIMHATIPGKFGKPEGWTPPNHRQVGVNLIGEYRGGPNLNEVSQNLIALRKRTSPPWHEGEFPKQKVTIESIDGEKILKTTIMEAVAQGWCTEDNKNKEMDINLAKAITDKVFKALTVKAVP